jgi:hypothetical protein
VLLGRVHRLLLIEQQKVRDLLRDAVHVHEPYMLDNKFIEFLAERLSLKGAQPAHIMAALF